jgi:hypothetical protein
MTCEEFERVLPELEGGRYTIEQEDHLRSCGQCSDLVLDLNAISREAQRLQAGDEPSPRVWNSIEIALRAEGLIRQPVEVQTASAARRWWPTWVVPLAAAALIAAGVLLHRQATNSSQLAENRAAPIATVQAPVDTASTSSDDKQLLDLVEARGPALRAAYENDLRRVNAYIRDAEMSAKNNPNDEIAQQYLMSAYEQKAMVYEIALQRSLP